MSKAEGGDIHVPKRTESTGEPASVERPETGTRLSAKEIHANVEVPKPTGGEISPKEAPTGPILFQGDHGPVAFRNLRVKELAK